jgi:putative ABC transport system permease protein
MDINSGQIPINNLQLTLAIGLILIPGLISTFLRLGLLKSLLWGTVRTFVQLSLIGYVLSYVFQLNNPGLIVLIVSLMCLIAAQTAGKRVAQVPYYSNVLSFISLWVSTFFIGSIVVVLIISPQPFYSAQIVIPIFGMILGNSMNAISLALDRLDREVRSRINEVEALLSFGATPWEAIRDCVKEAIRAGMTPTINSLMVVGLVSLPGMMTGQILGGVDPKQAVRYQIVVMLMIAAAVAIGCLILVGLSYKKIFTSDEAIRSELYISTHKNR